MPSELKRFFNKKNDFLNIFGSDDVLLNPMYTQCSLFNSLISLSKFNSVNTLSDKYIKHIKLAHAEDKVDVFKADKSICQCEKSMFLASLSETLESITLHRRIQSESVLKPVDCLYYAANCVLITDANSDNPGVKNLLFNDGEILVSEFEGNFEFPFAIVESVEGIFVSDTGKHCVYQIDAQNNSVTPAIGLHERNGEDDGPLNTAKLRSPTKRQPNIHRRASK